MKSYDLIKNKNLGFFKIYLELKRRIMYFNIRNANVRNLAYREYCFKKLKRKFKNKLRPLEGVSVSNPEFSNKIWICWFQGIDNAPDLVKSCLKSVKRYFPDKEIILIDETNFLEYVNIPDYIIKKWKKGLISYAHFSDILRLEVLIAHGGLWLDSTVYVTGNPKELFDNQPLFVFQSISLDRREKLAVNASNWLIYSCKNNPILILTRDLLYEYWKCYKHAINYNIFHLFFTMATKVYSEEWKKVPVFSNIPPHLLQFELLNTYDEKRYQQIIKLSSFHKLNYRINNIGDNTFYSYVIEGDNYE